MKKLLCLALMLGLLCIPFTASAEQIYVGDTYSFAYPDSWTTGADQEGVEFVLMMSDGMSNFNMTVMDIGIKLTNEQIDSMLAPVLLSNYQEMFNDVSMVELESPVQLGDNTYSVFGFTVNVMGMDIYMEQYIVMNGSVAYMFTATYVSADSAFINEVQATLATFTVG